MTDPDSGERSGLPRWVTLSVVAALLVAVLVVVVVLVSGGHRIPDHGPGERPSSGAPHVPPPH